MIQQLFYYLVDCVISFKMSETDDVATDDISSSSNAVVVTSRILSIAVILIEYVPNGSITSFKYEFDNSEECKSIVVSLFSNCNEI